MAANQSAFVPAAGSGRDIRRAVRHIPSRALKPLFRNVHSVSEHQFSPARHTGANDFLVHKAHPLRRHSLHVAEESGQALSE
jgi:hypothetical protein